ncbi:glycosyl hydrolase family 18 protein [Flavihumibacter petaseus]|uniref:chitinase n=1 Tax=Flavihumibacter petaseus NBRC 106054 TaxID=1220578 RepID=A0A0E9N594_9BACT|nr:glycosyl hydrolase family 18 protein [Flavihumibacter petaseus]GAO44515.1 putative glycosidase [Flavihumibacter petaseus NBRC 106054]
MRLYLMLLLAISCTKPATTQSVMPKPFRIVAYVPEADVTYLDSIPYDRVTHINYAFVNPAADGTYHGTLFLDSLVARAHRNRVQVLLSVGGGNPPGYFKALLAPGARPMVIRSLVQLLLKSGADGIDMDLEGDFITEHYEGFVSELKTALPENHQSFTAALATWCGERVTARALEAFDFINIMSYDKTGPWNPARPGPYSPYEMSLEDLYYWSNTRKVHKDRLVLGVPFYGYYFGPAGAGSMSFARIAVLGDNADQNDQWDLGGGNTIYYNGIPTIQRKSRLAREEAAGIMFWQTFQDHPGEHSLLSAILAALKM